ncbi:MAG: methyltransferase domain-containing protein [Spirochaetales bacterium]
MKKQTRRLLPSLETRSTEREIMDDFSEDEEALRKTLRRFEPINRLVSRSRYLLQSTVLRDVLERDARSFSILDVGAGGCDLMMALSRRASALGIEARITCADYDPRAVRFAREATEAYPNIEIVEADIFEAELGTFDYVFCNHLLHHFPDELAVAFLKRAEQMAGRGYLVNDIRRCRFAYVGITLLMGLLYPGSVPFHDGRTSVRRSFRPEELEELFRRAWANEHERPSVRTIAPTRVVVIGGPAFRL